MGARVKRVIAVANSLKRACAFDIRVRILVSEIKAFVHCVHTGFPMAKEPPWCGCLSCLTPLWSHCVLYDGVHYNHLALKQFGLLWGSVYNHVKLYSKHLDGNKTVKLSAIYANCAPQSAASGQPCCWCQIGHLFWRVGDAEESSTRRQTCHAGDRFMSVNWWPMNRAATR